ncbi:hypothetical protein FDI41_gp13 [Arthrobacter phage Piccoletto]|uniref:Uncharacterized protein n=2 Tax=Jawnskivirus TaxID=3425003 RepID=A0A222ZIV9_9CAUD|nr:hypothetical protein FDI26_gp13 [Arthrobacter phage Beans]YP_009612392.1 hypothetical protein FDI41_gp13 [Arthrobacter phage Piccoletto]ASR80644.1 hypothetical protein SEA_PICCOLETTO_13 [Arthrobacter phage Piccoletto]ASR84694.1 hypothetical protein SEA_BEANS_13 [Arthrobacter phage Beans]UVK62265.1 hypothetical protein SEA_NATHANVAAG_13 [Arthrobacter phage NathanVaag]
MSKATTIHNAMAHALVVDTAGHIVGGGESADIELDAVTYQLIDRGDIVIVEKPEPETADEPEKKTRASRRSGADEKTGD